MRQICSLWGKTTGIEVQVGVKSTGFCNELSFGLKISKSAANLEVFFTVYKCTRTLIHKISIHGDELINIVTKFTLKWYPFDNDK